MAYSVIYINIFEFRRNTTFDKNLDELTLDETSLDELGINKEKACQHAENRVVFTCGGKVV